MKPFTRSKRRGLIQKAQASGNIKQLKNLKSYKGGDSNDIEMGPPRPSPVPPPPITDQLTADDQEKAALNARKDQEIDQQQSQLASILTNVLSPTPNPNPYPNNNNTLPSNTGFILNPLEEADEEKRIIKTGRNLKEILTQAEELTEAYDANQNERMEIVKVIDIKPISQLNTSHLKQLQQLEPTLLKEAAEWNKLKTQLTLAREQIEQLSHLPSFRRDKFEKTRRRYIETLKSLQNTREGIEQELGLIRFILFNKIQSLPNNGDKLDILRTLQQNLTLDWSYIQDAKNTNCVPQLEQDRWVISLNQLTSSNRDTRIYEWPDPSDNNRPYITIFSQATSSGSAYFRFLDITAYRLHLEYINIMGYSRRAVPNLTEAKSREQENIDLSQYSLQLQQVVNELNQLLVPRPGLPLPTDDETHFVERVINVVHNITDNLENYSLVMDQGFSYNPPRYFEIEAGTGRILRPDKIRNEIEVQKTKQFRFRQYTVAPALVYEQQMISYSTRVNPPLTNINMSKEDLRAVNHEWLLIVEDLTLINIFQNAISNINFTNTSSFPLTTTATSYPLVNSTIYRGGGKEKSKSKKKRKQSIKKRSYLY